jgi:hypothetical protein
MPKVVQEYFVLGDWLLSVQTPFQSRQAKQLNITALVAVQERFRWVIETARRDGEQSPCKTGFMNGLLYDFYERYHCVFTVPSFSR